MKYLLDTSIVIAYFRRLPGGQVMDEEHDFFLSYIVMGELLQGVKNKAELKAITQLRTFFPIDTGSVAISERALQLTEQYYLKQNLTFFDALIAATALEHDAVLITLNEKHFRIIPGLKLEIPKG